MRGALLVFIFVALFAVAGCDSIEKPLESPVAQPKPPEYVPTPQSKALGKETYEEIYNMILTTHRAWLDKLAPVLKAREENSESFGGYRRALVKQVDDWKVLLKIRREWLAQQEFPEGHVARILDQSAYLAIMEMEAYLADLLGRYPYDPSYERQLMENLTEARKLLDEYQDPPKK